jgi:hypothetical protein
MECVSMIGTSPSRLLKSCALIGLGLGLTACGNLTAQRFDVATTNAAGTLKGVPFTLNKPKLTVTRTAGREGSPDIYAVKADYVPDPEQRYVLQIDPALLSSVDWTMGFDDTGTLTDTNAKLTDQTPTLLMSLAKLVVAAVAFADTSKPSEPESVAKIDATVREDLNGSAPVVWDARAGSFRRIPSNRIAAHKAAWDDLWARLKQAADYGQASSSFVYRDAMERTLLETALHLAKQGNVPRPSDQLNEGLESPYPNIKASASEINDAMVTYDRKKLRLIKAATLKARANLYAQYAVDPPHERQDLDTIERISAMVKDALSQIDSNASASLLLDILDVDPTEWQRREVAEIDKEINQRRFLLRVPDGTQALPAREDSDRELNGLLRRRAAILGVLPEYDRRVSLRKVMTVERAAGHYKAMSDEIAFLDKRLADADGSIKPSAALDAKLEAPVPAEFMVSADKPADG